MRSLTTTCWMMNSEQQRFSVCPGLRAVDSALFKRTRCAVVGIGRGLANTPTGLRLIAQGSTQRGVPWVHVRQMAVL